MNIILWIAQGILGMFILAGFMKATQPKEKLALRMPWVNDFTATQVKLIGVSQILGGIGVIVPWATGIAPFLTVLAALGLALVMVSAAIYHLSKGEYKAILTNTFFFALAIFVAAGRFAS
ncbi:MAG: rane protein [Bacteroidetes bacterium]|nr:rane protein [Bacteroidota bacterium]